MNPEPKKICEQCVYHSPQTESELEKCWRFARFVEHVVNDWTKDCEYFTKAENQP